MVSNGGGATRQPERKGEEAMTGYIETKFYDNGMATARYTTEKVKLNTSGDYDHYLDDIEGTSKMHVAVWVAENLDTTELRAVTDELWSGKVVNISAYV